MHPSPDFLIRRNACGKVNRADQVARVDELSGPPVVLSATTAQPESIAHFSEQGNKFSIFAYPRTHQQPVNGSRRHAAAADAILTYSAVSHLVYQASGPVPPA